ncbi:hypothetical protein PtrV1_06155 [Pyrenophora tritici-repentis]|nr:hypothetical protein PtrV1_06155 [Pyrenophora tritici-repentis]
MKAGARKSFILFFAIFCKNELIMHPERGDQGGHLGDT